MKLRREFLRERTSMGHQAPYRELPNWVKLYHAVRRPCTVCRFGDGNETEIEKIE
jgi:hypothetical protein